MKKMMTRIKQRKISEEEEEKTFEIKKSKEEDNNIIKYDRKNSKYKLTIGSSYITIEKRDNIKKSSRLFNTFK